MCQTLKDRASLIFLPYAENIGELSVTLTTESAAKGCEIPNRRAAQSPVDFEALKLPVMKTLESALDRNAFLFGFILDINFNFLGRINRRVSSTSERFQYWFIIRTSPLFICHRFGEERVLASSVLKIIY